MLCIPYALKGWDAAFAFGTTKDVYLRLDFQPKTRFDRFM